MKIPDLGYHFALRQGEVIRRTYGALLRGIVRQRINPPRQIDLEVFSYSNQQMLPEQVASIRSFLRYAGRPKSFTVVSDGSHSDYSKRLLKEIDPSVDVRSPEPVPPMLPEKLRRYLATHHTGKQLALIMSRPLDGPALYIDADVRFFAGASDLVQQIQKQNAPAFYLADCQFSGDERFIRDPSERRDPVNTGVLLLFQRLDWSLAIERFLQMEGEPNFFTNQTMTHLAMHQNGARPLDPARYVLQLDDQTLLRDRHANAAIVLRHYVNPVRHKFWTSLRH